MNNRKEVKWEMEKRKKMGENNEGKGRSGRERRGKKLKAVTLIGLNQVQLCLI